LWEEGYLEGSRTAVVWFLKRLPTTTNYLYLQYHDEMIFQEIFLMENWEQGTQNNYKKLN